MILIIFHRTSTVLYISHEVTFSLAVVAALRSEGGPLASYYARIA